MTMTPESLAALERAYPKKAKTAGQIYVDDLRCAKKRVSAALRASGVPLGRVQPLTHDLFRLVASDRLESDVGLQRSLKPQAQAKISSDAADAVHRLSFNDELQATLRQACSRALEGRGLTPGARDLVTIAMRVMT